MLGVSDSVTDDVLQEDLEHATGLLVDETADALDTSTASQTADGRLSNALYDFVRRTGTAYAKGPRLSDAAFGIRLQTGTHLSRYNSLDVLPGGPIFTQVEDNRCRRVCAIFREKLPTTSRVTARGMLILLQVDFGHVSIAFRVKSVSCNAEASDLQ